MGDPAVVEEGIVADQSWVKFAVEVESAREGVGEPVVEGVHEAAYDARSHIETEREQGSSHLPGAGQVHAAEDNGCEEGDLESLSELHERNHTTDAQETPSQPLNELCRSDFEPAASLPPALWHSLPLGGYALAPLNDRLDHQLHDHAETPQSQFHVGYG